MTAVGIARTRSGDAFRQALDVAGAVILLALLAPVLLVCGALVAVTSRGPVLFRQERVGMHERRFTMYKFRTMRHDADESVHREYVRRLLTEQAPTTSAPGGLYKLQRDARVTRVGEWLRRTSLDELPQLLNVVKGDMALVGPRPVLPYEAELFELAHRVRFDVRPGLTGLWQVSGRGAVSMREALDLDVAYVAARGFGVDVRILLKTVPVVLFRHGTE